MLYICTKFRENIFESFKVIELARFSFEYFQRVIILKNVGSVMVLFCAYCSMMLYIYIECHENTLDGIKSIMRTIFSLENFQRDMIPQKF